MTYMGPPSVGIGVVQHAVARAGVEPAEVEDVVSMGCAYPEGATGVNIARQSATRAGLPVTVPGVTLNRFCSSGLQTIDGRATRLRARAIFMSQAVRKAFSVCRPT